MRTSLLPIAAIAILCSSAWASARETGPASSENKALEAAARLLAGADEPSPEDLADTIEETESDGLWAPTTSYDPLLGDFVEEAARPGARNRSARQALAAKYGLSVAAFDAAMILLRDVRKHQYQPAWKAGLRARALRLVETGDRAPVTIMIASAIIGSVGGGDCDAGDIDELMRGSRNSDTDLWAIATSCVSGVAFATALERTRASRPALLYLAMNWTHGDPPSELAAVDTLLRPEFLMQVDDSQRDRVHADAARFKLNKLLALGLLDDALAFGDSLPSSIRTLALSPEKGKIRTKIGGYTLQTSAYDEPPAADYAAALALAGRADEARSVLDLIAPAAKRKQVRECLEAARERCEIGEYDGIPAAALVVDHLIDQPDADPYILVESIELSDSLPGGGVTEVLCRLLSRPGEREECAAARKLIAEKRVEKAGADSRGFWNAIESSGGQFYDNARSAYAARLASLGPTQEPTPYPRRNSVDPAPVPFRELPLPSEILARRPHGVVDAKSFAPLPPGYASVRIERSGQRVAAISLSQRFDPNGEVTAGGYWLHLSDDGGKTWQPSLYTGLAEHFPYIVPARYRMPLLNGDRIQLEVEEALIDTATIFYPPVGTRVRRKREGIYLDMPIADLRRDSDGDGLTDIAARHLLLDQPSAAGAPFIVGHDRDCSPPTRETLARLAILKQVFQVEARAIIEQVGPKAEAFGPWRRSAPTDMPPIFLRGDPSDYRCVALDRPMIVYSEADRERLRRYSPDFQLIELPSIRWNRDRTRGFVKWNMGWTGGTYRLSRVNDEWKLESIGQWIT